VHAVLPHTAHRRPSPPALREALEGRFDDLHAVWIGAILAHVDFLDEQIDSLDRRNLDPHPSRVDHHRAGSGP
jgi:hypothetical protein